VLIWALGFAAGWRVSEMGRPALDAPILPATGVWVDLMPAGWHFIACGECGYSYRFFYNSPAPWRATLSHDPVATEIMREMMKIDAAPDEEPDERPELGPPGPEEEELEL
jgi:hypothetical protein